MLKNDYGQKIDALKEQVKKFEEQKKKIDVQIKQVYSKIETLEKERSMEEYKVTFSLLKESGLFMEDIIKALNTKNFSDIQSKLSGVNSLAIDSK